MFANPWLCTGIVIEEKISAHCIPVRAERQGSVGRAYFCPPYQIVRTGAEDRRGGLENIYHPGHKWTSCPCAFLLNNC